MPTSTPLRLALTMGDPNGVGPELALRCAVEPPVPEGVKVAVVGSVEVFRDYAVRLGMADLRIAECTDWDAAVPGQLNVWPLDFADQRVKVVPGEMTAQAGELAMRSVERATELCVSGEADAMVTAPFSKEAVQQAGYDIPGHTEYIAERSGADEVVMMMVAGALRVGLVTAHVSLREVASQVTKEAILNKLSVMYQSLQEDFGIEEPQIAVLGLNPHAGDGGMMGREEIDVIGPAVEAFNENEVRAVGPLPADGFFGLRTDKQFDAVLCMYHDQGLAPFKALAFDEGVNFTAGLPIVRTSPVHGTAFDIAGKGKARTGSMNAAIQLAVEVALRRQSSAITGQ